MKSKVEAAKQFDATLVGKQQLLIKSKLKDNALIATHQPAAKAELKEQRQRHGLAK